MTKIKGAIITIQLTFREGYEQPATPSQVETLKPAIEAVCDALKDSMQAAFDGTPFDTTRFCESRIAGGIILDMEHIVTNEQRKSQYN